MKKLIKRSQYGPDGSAGTSPDRLLESMAGEFNWYSVRGENAVFKICMKYYGQADVSMEKFLKISERDMLATSGIGEASVRLIKRRLAPYGLRPGMNDIDLEIFRHSVRTESEEKAQEDIPKPAGNGRLFEICMTDTGAEDGSGSGVLFFIPDGYEIRPVNPDKIQGKTLSFVFHQ